MTRIDLARTRDLGEILRDAWRIFAANASVFLTIALVVVAPAGVLIDGVWGRALREGPDADPPTAVSVTSLVLGAFVLPTLVTAMLVAMVEALGRGEEPTIGAAFRRVRHVFGPALLVVALACAGIAVGLVLLVIPGLYLAVRWYFAAQAVVVDDLRGRAAIRRSGALVSGHWWRAAGTLLVSGLLFGLLGSILPALFSGANGALYVTAAVVGQAIALALTATASTLVYFDLRARHGEPWQALRSIDSAA